MRVVLYSRAGCHLCDAAREVLLAERAAHPVRRWWRSTSQATTSSSASTGSGSPWWRSTGEERFEYEVDPAELAAIVRGG